MKSLFTHQWDGNTALHMAAMEWRVNSVIALQSHLGIDVNIKNNEGLTAMEVHVHALYSTSMCISYIHVSITEITYKDDNAQYPCVLNHHRFLKANYYRQQMMAEQRM